MKINELKRIAEENDYKYEYDESCFRTRFKREVDGCTNKISINEWNENRMWISNDYFCDEKDFNMIKATMKYAETPPEDREEEKKFYLRHKWLNLDTNNYLPHNYLHLDVDDGSCMLDDNEEFSFTKIKLTEKEIKEIKKKFNTDLADFELVEVEE